MQRKSGTRLGTGNRWWMWSMLAQSIRNWVAQADRDEGCRQDGTTTAERQDSRRLRREARRLREEREILARATAWFARETGLKGFSG